MPACPRHGHIEPTCIFAYVILVVVHHIVVVGVRPLDSVEDNDAVEFESFGLVGGGDKETLGGVVEHARAVAEVALAQGVDFGEVTVQLLAESGGHVRVDYVVGEEVEYVLPFVDGFDDALVQQVAVDVVEFVGDGRQGPSWGGLGGVEPLPPCGGSR